MHSAALRQLLIVLLAAACLFFAGLGALPLVEPDEGRNAEVAREMLVSRDWITPHFDTLPYLDKPAIFFWLVAGSMRIFGKSEWAARFPSAVTALITALLVWFLARRMFQSGEPAAVRTTAATSGAGMTISGVEDGSNIRVGFSATALLAGITWATSPLVIAFSRQVILDMPLTLLLTTAMLCFWLSADRDDLRRISLNVCFFGSMGLATFLKGPVGFLIPLLSVSVYQALRGRFRDLRRLRWGLGSVIFLALTLPWFVTVSLRNPAFPRYAVWDEMLLRFATNHLHRAGGPFYYLPVFLGGLFPWSFCLVVAAWNRIRKWKLLNQDRYRAELFLVVWAGVVIVFFSISRSKLPGYILPATVPLSILMARIWTDVERPHQIPDWLSAGFATMIALGILTAASPQFFRFASLQRLARHKIPPNVTPFLNAEVFFTGAIVAATGILGRSIAHRHAGRPKLLFFASFILLAATVPLLLIRWAVPLKGYAEAYSSRRLAQAMLKSPEKMFPVYGYYYFRTGLPFYLGRPVGLVTSGGSETTSNYVVSQFQALRGARAEEPEEAGSSPGGKQARTGSGISKTFQRPESPGAGQLEHMLLIDSASLQGLSKWSVVPFLLIARNGAVPDVVRTLGSAEPLWSAWEYSVLKVNPGSSSNSPEPVMMIDRVIRKKH